MANVLDVARYFIIKSLNDEDVISHLKLQKLCYYGQGVFSKLSGGNKLFENDIEAWPHGPVVREVYNEYSKFGSSPIDVIDIDLNGLEVNPDELNSLEETYNYFSQYSAWRLRDMTHQEMPWLKNYESSSRNVIPFEDIENYFDKAITV